MRNHSYSALQTEIESIFTNNSLILVIDMADLPISEFKNQIIDLINKQDFCIITGETGSGKSTQISQYIVDALPDQCVVVT